MCCYIWYIQASPHPVQAICIFDHPRISLMCKPLLRYLIIYSGLPSTICYSWTNHQPHQHNHKVSISYVLSLVLYLIIIANSPAPHMTGLLLSASATTFTLDGRQCQYHSLQETLATSSSCCSNSSEWRCTSSSSDWWREERTPDTDSVSKCTRKTWGVHTL